MVIVVGIAIAALTTPLVIAAQEEGVPDIPAGYYGEITIDDEPADIGVTVEAEIDGEIRGSIAITEEGKYGSFEGGGERLTVEGHPDDPSDAEVVFYLDSDDFDRTKITDTDPETVIWESQDIQQIDLDVSDVDDRSPVVDEVTVNPDTTVDPSEEDNVAVTFSYSSIGPAIDPAKTDVEITINGTEVASNERVTIQVTETTTEVTIDSLKSNETIDLTLTVVDIEGNEATETVNITAKDPSSGSNGGNGGSSDRGGGGGGGNLPADLRIPTLGSGADQTAAETGDEIEFTLRLQNDGDMAGTENVTLRANGESIISEEIRVISGYEAEHTFRHVFTEPGEYEITAEGETFSEAVIETVSITGDPIDDPESEEISSEDGPVGGGGVSTDTDSLPGFGALITVLVLIFVTGVTIFQFGRK